ncbi:MAG: BMP family ABC transporter substrate-binding protein [Candidatus Izemoplasmatales bacterium]|nr:BMP family ABC transporter substrate-binding protein [Candidatus Izemoplasmatales bacterium]MDD4068968.1 BMP family ABC transporter substrate-binding protein [Candidatus Izemoplasmatales bacterium]MDY0139555.1 BMP family ABC transporter substrate-binding protein [Candidatus Izemoplasmatales bacterium]
MKKVFVLLLAVLSLTLFIGCNGETSSTTTTTADGTATTDPFEGEKIVLITDKGDITDKSFNQGAYEGVQNYATEMGIEYGYLKPTDATDAYYISAIETAINDGATVIVTPGYLFEPAINIVQSQFPDVKFILLDGNPANATDGTLGENVYSIFYAEEQVGFLAGYVAVMEGWRHLGFMGGMAVPAVQRYGHGYVQGAAKAAEELGLAADAITIEYLYTGDFVASPEVQAAAATMYSNGVDVIFACGGAVGQSVMAAAAKAGDKHVIGVDVDQSADSPTVVTSAMKSLSLSVEQALQAIYEDGTWEEDFGGVSVILGAAEGGVGMPEDFSKFDNFTKADYDSLFAKLVDATYTVSSVIGAFGDDGTASKQFETTQVKVNVIIFEG